MLTWFRRSDAPQYFVQELPGEGTREVSLVHEGCLKRLKLLLPMY